jgi:hypothetical protein
MDRDGGSLDGGYLLYMRWEEEYFMYKAYVFYMRIEI